ncbi:MAG: sigma-54-dependent transcriptional regulator [Granulosicoccaceae bacterium]
MNNNNQNSSFGADGPTNATEGNDRKLLFLSSGSADQNTIHQLRGADWQVSVVETISAAEDILDTDVFHVAVASIDGVSSESMEKLGKLFARQTIYWIAITPASMRGDPALSNLISMHCHDFHTHPVDTRQLVGTVGHAHGMAMLRPQIQNSALVKTDAVTLIGASEPMRNVVNTLYRAARVNAPTMILGEPGTGKSTAARAIHELSEEVGHDFVTIDCSMIAADQVVVELFGQERITDDGVRQVTKVGGIETARDGTLHIANVHLMQADLQMQMVRFLETGSFQRVDSTARIDANPRLVLSTDQDMEALIQDKQFREDLYYRMRVLCVELPPLRERIGDLEQLAEHFFERCSSERRSRVKGFSHAAQTAMHRYNWPGNLQELLNRVRRALIMADSNLIQASDLGLEDLEVGNGVISLEKARKQAEGDYIRTALNRNYHNVTETAQQLGVSRVTLYRLMKKYQIDIGTERRRDGSEA